MITLISERNLAEIPEDDVDVLKVMAHPVRLKIVNEFMHHKMCNVTQLTEILRIPPLLNEVKAGIVQKYVMLFVH